VTPLHNTLHTLFSYFDDVLLGNSMELDLVDTALFALSLDNVHADDLAELSKQYLYGDAANRYVMFLLCWSCFM